MPLSVEEQAELNLLQQSLGGKPKGGGLSAAEEIELRILQESLSAQPPQPVTGPMPQAVPQGMPSQPPATPQMQQQAQPQEATPAENRAGILRRIYEQMGQADPIVQDPRAYLKQQGANQPLLSGSMLQEMGASGVGEMVGRGLGRFAGPYAPLAIPILGGAGAAAGTFASRKLSGQDVSWKELAAEFGLTAAFGGAAEGTMTGVRKGLSRTPHGVDVGKELAGEQLRGRVPGYRRKGTEGRLREWFEPPQEKFLDGLFEMVRSSGDMLSSTSFKQGVDKLSDTQFKTVIQELSRISAGPNQKYFGIGEEAVRAFAALRKGTAFYGMDLGKLTHVRSQLRKAAANRKESAAVDAIEFFIDTLDDGIMNGRFLKGGESLPHLQQARKGWSQLKDFEDVEALIQQSRITRPTQKKYILNAGNFREAIQHPKTKLEMKASQALDRNLQGKAKVLDFIEKLDRVDLEKGPIENLPWARGISYLIAAGPAAQERFLRLVEGRRGKISAEEFVVVVNSARRLLSGGPPQQQQGPQSVFP